MADQVIGPFSTLAHAYLGVDTAFHSFRFNPDQVSWQYQENTNSQDTIGGRVVQLLSVNIQGFTVTGRAGSRAELQRMADNIRAIMGYHIKTSRPVYFRVPSRGWNFWVYVTAMPQIGWDVASTSYPYTLQLAVEEDIAGIQSKSLEAAAISRLKDRIGYNRGVHGGSPQAFAKIVKSVLAASPSNSSHPNGPAGGGTVVGGVFTTSGSTSGYRNPLRGVSNLSPRRIDEGVDYVGSGPVYAIGNGKVICAIGGDSINRTTWPPFVSYILTDGSRRGMAVFVAESIVINVHVGQTINSNTVIATMTGGGIETGWAVTSGEDWALAHSIYTEGDVTSFGVDFSNFMRALGAPGGV